MAVFNNVLHKTTKICQVYSESLLRLRPVPLTDVKGFGFLFRASVGKNRRI